VPSFDELRDAERELDNMDYSELYIGLKTDSDALQRMKDDLVPQHAIVLKYTMECLPGTTAYRVIWNDSPADCLKIMAQPFAEGTEKFIYSDFATKVLGVNEGSDNA